VGVQLTQDTVTRDIILVKSSR